jgi:hypothetical protein
MIGTTPVGAGAWYALRIRRYLLAGIGPVALAGTHFLVSFAMLRLDTPGAFGIFTFLFVAAQFTVALSNALFGAPLQALPVASAEGEENDAAAIVNATALAALTVGVVFGAIALATGLWKAAAAWYGLYTATMILRWVGRAWVYAADQPVRAAASDVSYALVTLCAFLIGIKYIHAVPESAAYGALALGAGISLIPFGRGFFRLLIARPSRRAGAIYRSIWQRHARWSLLGVVTMEAAANCHIYLVTVVAGAPAIAPLAAAALLLRPINVVQNALVDYERPQMARLFSAGAADELRRTMRFFYVVLMLVWLVSTVLAVGLIWYAPWLVISESYDLGVVRQATISWVVVTLCILLQIPRGALLQATGEFQALARATIWSSVVNVSAVAVTLMFLEPVWTIAAMCFGWLIDYALIRRAADRQLEKLDPAFA